MSDENMNPSTRGTINYSVPLWGVLSVIGTGALILISMHFTGLQTQEAVRELQIKVIRKRNAINKGQ